MRNCRLGDTIWTQTGKNSNFSGADGGVELQPHICLCLDNRHTSCGSLCATKQTRCAHALPTSKQRWAVGGSGWGHSPALLLWYWQIQSPQQHKNLMAAEEEITLRRPFYHTERMLVYSSAQCLLGLILA